LMVTGVKHPKKLYKFFYQEIRIGLNESHIRKCSSKQVQLPEAMFQKETNELFAQGYLLLRLLIARNLIA